MPVIDGTFHPHDGGLVLAETVVDFTSMHTLILDERRNVETAIMPSARRLAHSAIHLPAPSQHATDDFARRLQEALEHALRFGYRSAQRELRTLRKIEPLPVEARVIPDAGDYARLARQGLDGARQLVARRAQQTAFAVAVTAMTAAREAARAARDEAETIVAVVAATTRTVHNHVLELVGETLNLGRSAGALTMDTPPTFAMRSEQLDKAMCEQCGFLHGSIVEVDSTSYYDYMPPSGCYGGGRCRGVYVHADGVSQVRGPEPRERGPQPELPTIPPVRQPQRRAA